MKARPTILGANGLPVVSADRVRLEKQSRFNPLRDWTPDELTRQLEAFARGDIRELALVMQWLEDHDDTIATVAPKAKAAVSRHGYDVVLRDEIKPEQRKLAEDQQGVLQAFYDSLEATHAVDADQAGNMRLFIQQVMDGYGKGYAAHHTIWRPTTSGLRATLVHVPTWFFEAKLGRLRFLPSTWAVDGQPLEELGGRSAWMISRGRGVMLACVIARMFKQIPLQDWLTYSDRHAMPAFLGKTSATKDSPGWLQMRSAVAGMGAEFGAVINTGDELTVLDLATKGELPYEKLIDRMDRAMVMLWRGGDLSTLSRSNAVGANPQQEETDELDADNAEWVSETIDRQLSRIVLNWHFGDVPQLAKLRLRKRTRENLKEDLDLVKGAKDLGVRISKSWFVGKFGIVEADQGETALGESEPPAATPSTPAINSAEAKLVASSLAKALGVRAEILSPVQPVIERLASGVQDGGITDAEWLQLVEEAALSLPELFDPQTAEDLAADLEAAMGTAVLQGARDAIRDQSKQP
jgi:phage gp29-like protein